MLPIKEAIKLPIWIYGKITFRSLQGRIIIENKIYPGMIRIGRTDWYVSTSVPQSIWTINGILKFKGKINIYHGNYILVSKSGYLEIGTNGTFIGAGNKIICFERIIIGNHVEITWENQIIDTSFHYVEQLDNKNEISSLTKAIVIEDNCWIGNRTTVSKGTFLPSYSIVGSNSLVNKDFLTVGSYCMFAGSPAKLKMKCKRIFDKKLEKELDLKYGYDRTHL
jgi:acetyltransferase-like isoleucine patch superfamily enzyme